MLLLCSVQVVVAVLSGSTSTCCCCCCGVWCCLMWYVVSIVVTVFNTITTFIITVIIITALVSLSTAILSGSEKLESELLKFSDSLGSDSEESGIVLATVGGPLELVLERKPLLCFLIITSHLTITLDLVSMSLFSVITTLGWTDLTDLTTVQVWHWQLCYLTPCHIYFQVSWQISELWLYYYHY